MKTIATYGTLLALFFLSQILLPAQETRYRRGVDERTWTLNVWNSRYTIQECSFDGKITTVGTVSTTDGLTTFKDAPTPSAPSLVDGKQFLEMKDGQQVYLVEKAREKEFAAALKEKRPMAFLGDYFRRLGTQTEAQFLLNRPREEIKARHAKDDIQEIDDMIVVESVIQGVPCAIQYLMGKDHSRVSMVAYHFRPKETLSFDEGLALGRKLIKEFLKTDQISVNSLKLRGLPFTEIMGDQHEYWPYDYVQCWGVLDEMYQYDMYISADKQDGKPDSRLTGLRISIYAPPPPPTAPL